MIGKIKNLLRGASTVMSLYPNTGDELRMRFLDRSDAEALHDDWVKVGEDLRKAMSQYEQEQDLDNNE